MVEIAEANEDGDHNYFLAQQYVLDAVFHHVYVHQPKLRCYAENPPWKKQMNNWTNIYNIYPIKNKICHTLVDILAY